MPVDRDACPPHSQHFGQKFLGEIEGCQLADKSRAPQQPRQSRRLYVNGSPRDVYATFAALLCPKPDMFFYYRRPSTAPGFLIAGSAAAQQGRQHGCAPNARCRETSAIGSVSTWGQRERGSAHGVIAAP